ncbi:glycoside hydrolase family 25 [Bacillus wiedmannii]|uniref:Glycoside hydrolase family 25 n=1 Tax=Bacillus wiedmannii TaxID=1890302 RepID=A0A2A8GIV3_9BACI|nr:MULTISPECIES: GH25 family lysozyme [Bacillus cereus group]KAA0746022.1 glycoside hydrolase family 25 [Bacillus sp. AY3-1]MCP9281853.1 glycoside hydrolase family 25 [Bacillus wiedmannii]PEI66779.1 glycoside hydrolase family 25 [Bacillus wiedmannii]PEJ49477.1 glycoside hydrolase family 25 [Bacillus wiedmannii]PEL44362.1 glycoside hydrolase family 25 [Bacillus wiedmannii]
MGKIADFSYHNGTIDWGQVSKELDLVILRAQYGSNKPDNKYKEYVTGCKAYGVPHGAYAYGVYVSVEDAVTEAEDFMKRVDKDAKFLVLDVEDDTLASCGPDKLAEASQVFIDTCKAAGWKVGLYISHHMYEMYGLNKVEADFLWIPRYGTNDGNPQIKPDYSCDIWQYTDKGTLPGVSGSVDLNMLNSNKTLSWYLDKNNGGNNITGGNEGGQVKPVLPLGYLKISAEESWVYEKPDENSKVVKKVYKDSRHNYLANAWDGKRFWFKIAENNWITEYDAAIEKDGRSKGVIWNNKEGLECFHYSIAESGVRSRIGIGQWEVELRENKDWIYIKDKGWVYFNESYIKWIR